MYIRTYIFNVYSNIFVVFKCSQVLLIFSQQLLYLLILHGYEYLIGILFLSINPGSIQCTIQREKILSKNVYITGTQLAISLKVIFRQHFYNLRLHFIRTMCCQFEFHGFSLTVISWFRLLGQSPKVKCCVRPSVAPRWPVDARVSFAYVE